MNNFSVFLQESLAKQQDNIQSYTVATQKVWLKKATARHSTWIYTPLRWLARLFKLNALTPIPNLGGTQAIQCEIQRIEALKALGVSVPQILATQPEGLLTLDAGQQYGLPMYQLDQTLAQCPDPVKKFQYFRYALDAIQHIHNQNSYLSEAFARNILVDEQFHFIFIDFETDPGRVLDIATCQARDWLCFLFSTVRAFDEQELQQVSEMICTCVQNHPAVYQHIRDVGNKLRWANRFNFKRIGHDGQRIQQCLLFFQILEKYRPSQLPTA
ncbi:BUD32 family EKC/KEOPS complex subunit [Acinetobacter larvae]|uniref:Serine/threonine protein kinase n=1 Tax=Acinetobacter larvae TaxID=1789224 RepID=A0A1B2M1J8_9GAMM|nr:serine/threonine protein kinase [Acinetobacter larvae]AOA59068.1 serine/threonine protein kinase [Acinetobacter larvae]